jgi:hypothetical protein
MVSCGTSVVVAGASELSVPVAGIVTFPLSRGVSVHAGPTQAGGDALRWWSRVSGSPIEDVVAEAAKSSPGAGGVVFTPHLMGERAPLWDSDVRGSSSASVQAPRGRTWLGPCSKASPCPRGKSLWVDVYEPLYRACAASYGALAGVHVELSGWRGSTRAVLDA